ncbi:hypothetical protein DFJ74DRAFT_700560 [Hyaloraphidium curvatum]|nr:hypothetical protein DFJ74DRAFT_700560 [Hyaloraphidium curvatum]
MAPSIDSAPAPPAPAAKQPATWQLFPSVPFAARKNVAAPRYHVAKHTVLPPVLAYAGITATDLTRSIGTELTGLNLVEVTPDQVEALKVLVAQRGGLFFRGQDDLDLDAQQRLGLKFGPLHRHPNARGPEGYPDVLPVNAGPNSTIVAGDAWHSDVSCDKVPPGITILNILENPETGADTLWASAEALYAKLSPTLRGFLATLTAVHDSKQAGLASRYGTLQREEDPSFPVRVHPVVRTHPTTGQRSLYLEPAESRALLQLLFDHVAYSSDCQVRWKWTDRSVAIWDNRNTLHDVSWDYFPYSRKGFRVAVLSEEPFFDPSRGEVREILDAEAYLAEVGKPKKLRNGAANVEINGQVR